MSDAAASFRRLWSEAWDSPAAPPCEHLLALYGEAHRHYHTAAHVVDCLGQVALFERSNGSPAERAVRLALFYHDAIYDPKRSDNEALSAQLAREDLASSISAAELSTIERLIRATDHKQRPALPDEALIVDADLAILGTARAAFDGYEAAIRAEYAWVPEEKFRAGRAGVLRRFLERPAIYTTAWFQGQYEAAARVNLLRSLAALDRSRVNPA